MKITNILPIAFLGSIASGLTIDKRANSSVSTSAAAEAAGKNCKNSPQNRGCWGNGFNINTDTETSWPNTGVTAEVSMPKFIP